LKAQPPSERADLVWHHFRCSFVRLGPLMSLPSGLYLRPPCVVGRKHLMFPLAPMRDDSRTLERNCARRASISRSLGHWSSHVGFLSSNCESYHQDVPMSERSNFYTSGRAMLLPRVLATPVASPTAHPASLSSSSKSLSRAALSQHELITQFERTHPNPARTCRPNQEARL